MKILLQGIPYTRIKFDRFTFVEGIHLKTTELSQKISVVRKKNTRFSMFEVSVTKYEGRSESKERFAIQRYLLITGKKQNMQVL